MNREIMDRIYEYDGDESVSFFAAFFLKIRLFFSPRASREAERLGLARDLLKEAPFPQTPDIEARVMALVMREKVPFEEAGFYDWMDGPERETPGGISIGGWVFTGFIILVSLSTAFLGFDFAHVAAFCGDFFLLPVGIVVGGILTAYGAVFIGSHLEELSKRFGLR